MDWPTAYRTKTTQLIIIVCAAILWWAKAAAEDRWVTYTSCADVRRMTIIDDTLFLATGGGILAVDPNSPDEGRTFTNLDGLGTTDISDIIVDGSGQKWAVGYGRLIKFAVDGSQQYLFMDNDSKLIDLQCVADDGDYLWVGTPSGLVLFSKTLEGGLIQDSYQLFASLDAAPSVADILIEGDSIWIATSAGLAVADKSDLEALKSPLRWTGFTSTTNPEISGAVMHRLARFEDETYLGTSQGLFRLDRSASDTVFTKLLGGSSPNVTDLRAERDSLFIYRAESFSVLRNSSISNLGTTGMPSFPSTGAGNSVHRWVGISNQGIYEDVAVGGQFTRYAYAGLPSNNITDLAATNSGLVTALFQNRKVGELRDGQWIVRELGVSGASTCLTTDSNSSRWAGTFGSGVIEVTDDSMTRWDTTGTTLRGNNDPNGHNYIVVRGLSVNGHYLYASCFRAYNGYPVAIADLDRVEESDGWDSLGIGNGILDTFVTGLTCSGNYLALGTESNGLYLYYLGPDPFDKSDDTCHHLTSDNVYLRSNVVRVVKFAPDGSLWIGTNRGISRWDWGIDQCVDVNLPGGVGSDITDIDFDTRGNVWVSTQSGLARFDATSGEFRVLNSINSGLVSDQIQCLTLDQFTGNLWIGTTSGISLFKSAITTPTQSLDSVRAFPNPYVINSSTDRLNFNFARPGRVTIFSISGEPVCEMAVNESWNGKNGAGKDVASGVYIFVIMDDEGNTGRGKFLLVRQ